jgi:hypothetical protein
MLIAFGLYFQHSDLEDLVVISEGKDVPLC